MKSDGEHCINSDGYMNDFWAHCSAHLERELTPQQFQTWIKPLGPVAFDEGAKTLSIAAPNGFKLDWVKNQFSGRISDLARDFWSLPIEVQFVLDQKAGQGRVQGKPGQAPSSTPAENGDAVSRGASALITQSTAADNAAGE